MKQCREHNCPLQDICRGAVDNETWWNISDDCEIFAFVKKQDDTIFALENRLKECENGYNGTLALERCKLHDAEEKVKKLTEENERLRAEKETLEIYNADYKFKNKEVMAFNRRWAKECADLQEECDLIKEKTEENIKLRLAMQFGTYTDKDTVKIADVFRLIDQISKDMLEGDK